jgi:hypothetical protein
MNDTQILDWLEKNFEQVVPGRDDQGNRVFRRLVATDRDSRGLAVRTYAQREYVRIRELVTDVLGVVADPVATGQCVPGAENLEASRLREAKDPMLKDAPPAPMGTEVPWPKE